MESIAQNVTSLRTDQMVADATREKLNPLLKEVCNILDEARAAGLTVNFAVAQDSFGRFRPDITIVKPL